MTSIRITLRNKTKQELKRRCQSARSRGDVATYRRIIAVLGVADNCTYATVCAFLGVCRESVRLWVRAFLLNGAEGLKSGKSSGRPPKLTKSQRRELARIITKGPEAVGFSGACWRSPMIQSLIENTFGVLYSANYIAQLLKNMGFTYQKAKFVSDHKDPEKRKEWIEKTWPEIVKLAAQKHAHILFGDEVSFPQWGSLSYTWAKKGKQPVVKTSGKRKGYKVMGLIDYFTGRFFSKAYEGRLNSESYATYLKEVLRGTKKHIILIQDGARYHTSAAMKEFFEKHSRRITVYQLPSYSPDYNPIEKLWKKIKEKDIHLHYFPTFESLKTKVEEALVRFKDLKHEIISLFGFYENLGEA